MRVRYGKPIKVKSLLGQCNISFSKTSASNITFYPKNNGSFGYGYESNLTKTVNRQANHKYFILLNTNDFTYTWSYLGIWDTNSSGYSSDNRQAPTKVGNGDYYCVISPTTDASSGVPTLQYGSTDSTATLIANYALIIDLTEIGLDTLTAQQFYNKYNKYFTLIATGEEITIDDKAGQVVGQTMYGYNQLVSIINKTKTKTTTSTTYISMDSASITFYSSHKYLITGDATKSTNANIRMRYPSLDTTFVDNGYWIGNPSENITALTFQISSTDGEDATGTIDNIQAIDLTDWYGSGNEPTTIEEFKAKFPNDYYGYSPEIIRLTQGMINNLPVYGYNQMLAVNQKNNVNGITWTPQADGISWLLSGTATGGYSSWSVSGFVNSHKYLERMNVLENPNNISLKCGMLNVTGGTTSSITSGETYLIKEFTNTSGSSYFGITYASQSNLTGVKLRLELVDLTDWYGSGNEPTTISEFKETFPHKYYEFSKTRMLNKYMINYSGINTKFLRGKVAGGSSDIYYGYNQLLDGLSDNYRTDNLNYVFDSSTNKVTITVPASGVSAISRISLPMLKTVAGHKYLFFEHIKTGSTIPATKAVSTTYHDSTNTVTIIDNMQPNTDYDVAVFMNGVTNYTNDLFRICYLQGTKYEGGTAEISWSNLIDLTDWFGAGKEPSTVAEFKEKFIKEYYGFCPTPIKLTRYQIESLPNYGYNQLANILSASNVTSENMTKTFNEIGKITLTTTSGALSNITRASFTADIIEGHKYYLAEKIKIGSNIPATKIVVTDKQDKLFLTEIITSNTQANTSYDYAIIKTATGSYTGDLIRFVYLQGTKYENVTFDVENIIFIDLTDWYGAGSEPTTIEEFKATFPNLYYPYSKKRLLNKYQINKLAS